MFIIDSHCHAGKGDGLTGPWDTNASLTKYLQRAKEAGIDKTVIFPPIHSNYAQANRALANIIQKQPRHFFGYAFVNAAKNKGQILQMVRLAVRQYGFCGIKLHRYDARISREVCETAKVLVLPVLYDVLGEIQSIELFAKAYPQVNFIIPHLGSFADDWKAQSAFIDKLVKFPNIYTDTSAVKRFDLLEEAIQRAGAKKVLFGSDGPWLHPGLELEKIFLLKLSPSEEALVLGGNFLRLANKQ
ncbi:amidohydrolase family protein [Rapidithrix thailandica]|uniref:Amidohydrolase family protein n=1 Tax=Rapidithrix thailandica TaxID=413964 RepID=A0AAW9RRA9_9BACT